MPEAEAQAPALVADVGGTHTRLGLARGGRLVEGSQVVRANAGHGGLAEMIADYLLAVGTGPPAAICAGVAGPVRGDAVQMTNLDWRIEAAALARATGAGRVVLLNDLQAQAHALDDLPEGAVTVLRPGAGVADDARRLVLGLGTSCNVAVAHRLGTGLFVPPAESGHAGLPHCTGALGQLIDHLAQEAPHRPVDAALSGPGLARIHRWLGGQGCDARAVVAAHAAGTDPRATRALALFAELLGRVAGDLALAHLPMGGIHLIGGAARAVAPHLMPLGFEAAFTAKGPYAGLVAEIPVALVADDAAALRGCARHLAAAA
ncbi:glucokinase [Roseovarius salinarum]|uniref:glucokinase n=1 Tax=Roseovarius salinarum TaxID=1981892 RepID=UPI000C33851E|nr:glucokinase [Roseovarius salinarum]